MSLEDGGVFLFPDGRKFRANLEAHEGWTFVPHELEQFIPRSWREALSKLLFLLEDGKIVSINFYTSPSVVDTGWTLADLTRETPVQQNRGTTYGKTHQTKHPEQQDPDR